MVFGVAGGRARGRGVAADRRMLAYGFISFHLVVM